MKELKKKKKRADVKRTCVESRSDSTAVTCGSSTEVYARVEALQNVGLYCSYIDCEIYK
jgi:hypothetical protein